MQNSSRWSMSRFLVPCLVALALLSARFAKADTVFDVSGSAKNVTAVSLGSCTSGETCPFSGKFTVNVTAGTADGVDIRLPGLTAFDTVIFSGPMTVGWEIDASNSSNDDLALDFITTPAPGSLVGFAGGPIVGNFADTPTGTFLYLALGGSITPVPEPSSLGILAVDLLAFAGIIRLRKRKPVVTG